MSSGWRLAFKCKLQRETDEKATRLFTELYRVNKRVFPGRHGRCRAKLPREKDVLRIHSCVMQLTNCMFICLGKGEDAIARREHIQRCVGMSASVLFATYTDNVEKYAVLFKAHGLEIPPILRVQ